MRIARAPQLRAAVVLAAALSVTTGCAVIEFFIGPSSRTLWEADLRTARILRDELTGDQGYYTKDSSLAADKRAELTKSLRTVTAALSGPVEGKGVRMDLEKQLAPHAKRYLDYVDADTTLTAEEKAILKEPVQKFLKRTGLDK